MPDIIDDKSEHCIPFLLERLRIHQERHAGNPDAPPFFLGMNGVQGAGKTTLVRTLSTILRSTPHFLPTTVVSIDDLYHPRTHLQHLATTNPHNPLIQHRGQPSTHDLPLALSVFSSLRRGLLTKIPAYDKSAYHGKGERLPEEGWEVVNKPGEGRVRVVIFEGWCVGFRALGKEELERKWRDAVRQKATEEEGYIGRLGHNKLEDVQLVNEALRGYDVLTEFVFLSCLVSNRPWITIQTMSNSVASTLQSARRVDPHVRPSSLPNYGTPTQSIDIPPTSDAANMHDVYSWRQDQETALHASKGMGMSDEQVVKFVDGYYPSYELFTDSLRNGVFHGQDAKGRQLRLVVGTDRK
ncbi:MAG: hypothetical protein M1830_006768, partial [Pleopsidium flavum]